MIADEVRSEIDQLGSVAVSPGLCAVAVRLAQALDAIPIDDAPTSQAVIADKLTAVMTKVRALSPPMVKGDAVDDIGEQREKRRREAARKLVESS